MSLPARRSSSSARREHRDVPTTRYGMPYEERAIAITPADSVAPTRAVLQALLAGKNYPDGAVGRMAVEVLAAAYMSQRAGRQDDRARVGEAAARPQVSVGLKIGR